MNATTDKASSLNLADIASDPNCLQGLKRGELRALWQAHLPRKALSPTPVLLMHELAFAAQAKVNGGLDSETSLSLKQLLRGIEIEASASRSPKAQPKPTRSQKLQSGTRLVRHWHGHDHEVTVISGAYHYHGKEYRSLTQIAKLITGAHWSGPRFFGVNKLHSSH